jgi:hypothetical protein
MLLLLSVALFYVRFVIQHIAGGEKNKTIKLQISQSLLLRNPVRHYLLKECL